tara:strand:+ start:91 stop:495 length:405 start_codon:yes stop_codon:yes gene_type:complete
MYKIKKIYDQKQIIALVFKFNKKKFKGIKFLTNKNLPFQIGLMSHPSKYKIIPHYHKIIKRLNKSMSEFIYIISGKLKVDFYNKKRILFKSTLLTTKDMILLIKGGHGFKTLSKTEMIEVKQGPFNNNKDKVKF